VASRTVAVGDFVPLQAAVVRIVAKPRIENDRRCPAITRVGRYPSSCRYRETPEPTELC
jgi:hypothetical protein